MEFIHTDHQSIVSHREVGKQTESFAAALKAALREDPDVILVGEMRDLETISLALTTAETGHLVLELYIQVEHLVPSTGLLMCFPRTTRANKSSNFFIT